MVSMEQLDLRVPGMTCAHCTAAVEEEIAALPGVASVVADIDSKAVTVAGATLDEAAVRAAIAEAGFEAE